MSEMVHLGFIGYGEVGKIFSAGLRAQPGVRTVKLALGKPWTQ